MGKINVDMGINQLVEELGENNNVAVVEPPVEREEESKRWQPKEWTVEYERIVMMDLMGLKGVEIAERTGYTPQHVYNILGCDEAIAIQKMLLKRMREENVDISKELQKIQELTVKRLKKSLEDDNVFSESRLGLIRAGIDVMKGMGEYLKNSPTTQVTNQFTLPESVADKFIAGLEKSDEARRLLLEKGREIAVVESINE